MGSIVGFVALTLLSYFLIVLNIPVLIIPIVITGLVFLIKPLKKTLGQIKIKPNLQTILIILVFTLGILGQLAIIAPSGTFQNGDMVFWSSNGHDGAWHIALMEELKRGWPLQDPGFAGVKLVNYHYLSDVLPAIVSKYLPISDALIYFQIFPLIYSVFLGASAFYLTKKITHNFSASIWATIFTYFAGSFGFIVTYIKNKTIGGDSLFWGPQPQSASGNPPQIASCFLLLSGIYFLLSLLQTKNTRARKLYFVICVLIFGTITSFKVYAGIILLGALGITGVWQLIKERKIQLLVLTTISAILAAILYLPNTSGSVAFLIFQPWWFIRTMIVEPSRLNLVDWELRRQTYIADHNWKRVISLEGVGFLIFFFGNLGMRFIGLWEYLKSHLIIKTIIILSLLLPLLFLQKGVAGNTSQFLQYYILLFGILAGIATAKIVSKIKILAPIIILIMIPTQVGLIYEFYSRPAFAKITAGEMQALAFVKNNTNDQAVVITPLYNQYLNLPGPTPNIWDWFDTSYVAAFSSRRTYFDDYEQVDIMGYDAKDRIATKKTIFESADMADVKTALAKTGANILYYPNAEAPLVSPDKIGLAKIFENQEVTIWKIN